MSFLVVRGADLTRLMVTLGIGLMLHEAANKAAFITGGVDGLSGVHDGKLVRRCSRSASTAGPPTLQPRRAVPAVRALRRIVNSPFGLSLRGIREGGKRMPAIGSPVPRRLIAVFTLRPRSPASPARCSRRRTQFVGLDALGFPRSAELLIMLVLGGTGGSTARWSAPPST